jgi:outer membrane protein assembly factor BamB
VAGYNPGVAKRVVLPLIASFSLLAGLPALEPVVATPFDIRHDADELLDDLQAKRGETGALLERVQTLLAAHGDSMIAKGELCAPLAEFFAIRLAALGLKDEFARTFAGTADRRLKDLVAAGASEAEFRRLALSYPGTPAATQAWRRLANLAWDSGRMGLYLECAAKSGDAAGKPLSERVAAATRLLAPDAAPELPPSLDGMEEMWHIEVDDLGAKPVGSQRPGRRARRAAVPTADRFVLCTGPGDLTAASDGTRFFLFDHLVGRIQGEVRSLGNSPLGVNQCRPAASRDGFVALGWLEDHATLLCLDRLGEVRWHWNTPTLGNYPALSAPVILDDLVVIASLVTTNQEGAELRALAFHAATGKPAWNTLVARIPSPRQLGMGGYDYAFVSPSLAVHDGYLLVLSNNGVLSRIGIDGNVQRIWSYPSSIEDLDDGSANGRGLARQGALVSDGEFAVATPADSPGLVLTLGPDDQEPRRFLGDGANGEVMDVAAGQALLAGNSTIALVDLKAGKTRWTQPFLGKGGVQGRMGPARVLVCSREQMALFDLAKGTPISSRGLAQPMSISVTPELLMLATGEHVVGRGRGASFLERLNAAAAAHPADYRPWATLASFQESRGDRDQAFASLVQALSRGAPADCAERAARLVRVQLEVAAGDAKAFPGPLAKLESLITHDDRLKGEIAMWKGRHAELQGDAPHALESYRAALGFPSHLMQLKDRIEADVHTLAEAGLQRLRVPPPPPAEAAVVPSKPLPEWTFPSHRCPADSSQPSPTLVAGDLAVGYGDGFLIATRLADGKEAWRRTPVRPVLGVKAGGLVGPAEGPEGIAIEVVAGSSAAGAGMQSGDLLTSFNGRKTVNFERDLRGQVLTMEPRGPFTATVLREGRSLDLKGILGGEPVAPLAANRTTVLVWLTQALGQARQAQKPEGMWFAAHDLATGAKLLRYSLKYATDNGDPPPRPLLTPNDLVLTMEANDLVCLPVRGAGDAEDDAAQPLWRLPMGENTMDQVHLLGEDWLWLPEDGRNRINLVDLKTGRTRFVLPEDLSATPVLDGSDCFCLGEQNHITCWDLGVGRLRWSTDRAYGKLIAARGDAVFALNENNQLTILDRANGNVRRLFGDWVTVEGWRVDAGRLCLHVRHEDHSQALASLDMPGGTVRWERRLPRGLEVHQLVVAPDAFGCVLNDNQAEASLVMIGPSGEIRQACPLKAKESVLAVPGGAIAAGPDGLRVLPAAIAAAPAPLRSVEAADGAGLEAIANATLPKLSWQAVGKGTYALARLKGSLLVFARVEPDGDPIEVRIGDDEPAIDLLGQSILFQLRGPQLPAPNGWRVSGSARLNAAEDKVWLGVVRLEPPVTRAPAAALLVRASSGEAVDGPKTPWWLHRGWRAVLGGP